MRLLWVPLPIQLYYLVCQKQIKSLSKTYESALLHIAVWKPAYVYGYSDPQYFIEQEGKGKDAML